MGEVDGALRRDGSMLWTKKSASPLHRRCHIQSFLCRQFSIGHSSSQDEDRVVNPTESETCATLSEVVGGGVIREEITTCLLSEEDTFCFSKVLQTCRGLPRIKAYLNTGNSSQLIRIRLSRVPEPCLSQHIGTMGVTDLDTLLYLVSDRRGPPRFRAMRILGLQNRKTCRDSEMLQGDSVVEYGRHFLGHLDRVYVESREHVLRLIRT